MPAGTAGSRAATACPSESQYPTRERDGPDEPEKHGVVEGRTDVDAVEVRVVANDDRDRPHDEHDPPREREDDDGLEGVEAALPDAPGDRKRDRDRDADREDDHGCHG